MHMTSTAIAYHLEWIHKLLSLCETRQIPIWLQGGWAVDARLGRITREHEDIDFTIAETAMPHFRALLTSLGATAWEETDYGFLVCLDGIVLDCEPCTPHETGFRLDGLPDSCPTIKEGMLHGKPVPCVSWQAIMWDYFYYLREVPYDLWPEKDKTSYAVICTHLGKECITAWQKAFNATR